MSTPVLGMVLKGYPRISETFIANEIRLLEELGLRIRIFSMRHPREQFFHDTVRKIEARVDYLPTELLLDFPRLFLPGVLEAVRQPGPFLAALDRARKRFARTRSLGTLKHFLQGAFMVNRFLRRSPEVVHLHAHFAHSPASVAMFAGMFSGLPFSFTAHAKDIYTTDTDQLKEKMTLASHVVTCTRYNKQYLESLFNGSAPPIFCVYHGIDLQQFAGHEPPRQPHNPCRILTVARLTAKKGILTLLQALAVLRDRGVDFEYILIGDGEDRDTVLETIVRLNLQDYCRWRGTLSHDRVLEEFCRADVFVLACEIAPNGDRDGIPNVLVESLAMGLPAAGTTVSALPEIIRHGETGLLTEPGNPITMADNILRLLSDPDLRSRVISQGKALVRSAFDNRLLIKDLAAVYCRNISALNCS